MKSKELTEELNNLFDEDFILMVYGFFGGVWIMIGYMTIQLIGAFL